MHCNESPDVDVSWLAFMAAFLKVVRTCKLVPEVASLNEWALTATPLLSRYAGLLGKWLSPSPTPLEL
jgi:hypothetical protein